jgi:hypothetical protein
VYVSWSSSSTYGGDSGNRIFVLYWRRSLIRVSVIRGSTVLFSQPKDGAVAPTRLNAVSNGYVYTNLHGCTGSNVRLHRVNIRSDSHGGS